MLTWKGAVNQELGKEGQKDESKEGRRNETKNKTVLVQALLLWSWKALSITVKCFTTQPAHIQTHTKCIRCFYRVLAIEFVFRWFSATILTFSVDKKRERLCTTQHWSGTITQNTGDIAEHPDGGSFRAAQNYIGTYYLQLKATQIAAIHTMQLHTSQQPTQQGKKWSGRGVSPIPFCKTY